MTHKRFTSFVFFFLSISIFSQDINSRQSSQQETLNSIISELRNNAYGTALTIVDSALLDEPKLLQEQYDLNNNRYLSQLYGFKGQISWVLDSSYSDEYFLNSIRYAQKINDSNTIGKNYLNLGRTYETRADYSTSIDFYIKALPYLKTDCGLYSRTLDNISYSLCIQEKHEEALPYLYQAFSISESCNDLAQKVNIYNSLAAFYTSQNINKDSVPIYLDKALALAQEVGYLEGVSISNSNYADYYLANQNYRQALTYCQYGLAEAIEIKDIESKGISLLQLGLIHFKLEHFDEAIRYYEDAILTFSQINATEYESDVFFNLSESYKQIGNYEQAYTYYKAYQTLNDSIKSSEKVKEFNDILVKYETNKVKAEKELVVKENIIQQQTIQQNKTQLLTLVIIFTLVIIVITIVGVYFNSRKKAKLIELELAETQHRLSMEKELRKSEIKSIRAQMNPHFIFNAINSIQALVLEKNKDEAYQYLNFFSNLIRNTLNFSEQEFIPIETEVEFISTYLALEKLRFNSDFSYKIQHTTIPQETLIPSIIIQPFIENAIKHGLFHKQGNKEVTIEFKLIDNMHMICEIVDNGIGRNAAEVIQKKMNDKHISFATEAIERRITILKSFYGAKVDYKTIDLFAEDGKTSAGTKVTITLPIKLVK